MRILVFGPSGMLGTEVCKAVVAAGHELWATTADIADTYDLARERYSGRPDAVINCAGIVPERYRDRDTKRVMQVNGTSPHLIAVAFADSHVVQVSTDCVFSGAGGRNVPRRTVDDPNPIGFYGLSKLLGELREPGTTTVRTSFVGAKHGLMRWMLDQTGEINGWTDAWWSGSTVQDVAASLVRIAAGPPQGLIHLATPEAISKYDALRFMRDAFNREDLIIVPKDKPKIYRALAPTVEMRPFAEAIREALP